MTRSKPDHPILVRLDMIGYKPLLSSMDSNLEAFSYNPTDDSFSSLSVRVNENTNYLNQLFLSYYVELLLQRPK